MLDMLVGGAPTVTLHMSWPAPAALPDTEDEPALAGRLFFDAPMSYLHVPADTLDDVCRFSDPLAYRLAIGELKHTLEQREGVTSTTEQVRLLLETDPGQSSQWVADELAVKAGYRARKAFMAARWSGFAHSEEKTRASRCNAWPRISCRTVWILSLIHI